MSYIHFSQTKWKLNVKELLNDDGKNALKNGKYLDIFKPLRAHAYDEDFSESISSKRDQIFSGPNFDAPKQMYNHWRYWLHYQLNEKGEFNVVELNDENRHNLNPGLNICDDTWFKFHNKLYFVYQPLKKIVPLSMFWTHKGKDYVVGRRKMYERILYRPQDFEKNAKFMFKAIPSEWEY